MALTSVAEIISESMFCKEQFPKSASESRNQGEFEALVGTALTEAAAETKQRVGNTNYASLDAEVLVNITTAEKYLAVSKMYNRLISVVAAWDAEVLPSEFVESDVCERQRDWYAGEWSRITGLYAEEPMVGGAMPLLIARGVTLEVEA